MPLLMFALEPQDPLAQAVASELGVLLAPHEDRLFADGERKLRPLVSPRGADAYVLAGLHSSPDASPHDKLVRLLMFVGALRDHGAARVTAVVPYLAYARKDRRTKPFDPLSLRYVAQMFEALGGAQLIVLEAHNPAALENAFRCPVLSLEAHRAFGSLAAEMAPAGPLAVVSPDPGGVKRAQLWREALEEQLERPVGFAMVDKRRSSGLVSGGSLVAGEVRGATALLLDDLIASGETMLRAAVALRHAGAARVIALAAHGLFIDNAPKVLADDSIERIVVTDSVPPWRLPPSATAVAHKLRVVSCVPLLAEAIRTSHEGWPL